MMSIAELISLYNVQTTLVKAGIVLGVYIILALFYYFVIREILLASAKRTKTTLDDIIIERTSTAILALLVVLGLRNALMVLNDFPTTVDHLVNTITILIISYIVIATSDAMFSEIGHKIAARTKTQLDDQLIPLGRKVLKIILVIIAVLFVLKEWNVNIAPILAGMGIAGLVLGFALQSSLENIFSGVTMILDKSIKVGDTVKLSDGNSGLITEVGLRAVKIKAFNNDELVVPNAQLAKMTIRNYGLPEPLSRCEVKLGITYGSDIKKAKKLMLDTVAGVENVLKEPAPSANFIKFGDSALEFEIFFWVHQYNQRYNAQVAAREKLHDSLQKAGIEIPFPVRTVYLKK